MNEFSKAKRLIGHTAERIADEITGMLAAMPEAVARDNAIWMLIDELNERHPEAMAWLDAHDGEASMRLSVALSDWFDRPEKRGLRAPPDDGASA